MPGSGQPGWAGCGQMYRYCYHNRQLAASGGRTWSANVLATGFGLFNQGVNWLAAKTGFTSAVGCATRPSWAGCSQAGVTVAMAAITFGTDGLSEAADAALQAVEEAATAPEAATGAASRFSVDANGVATDLNGVRPPGPYVRPSGSVTAAQRASVQGLPCVDCGTIAPTQVADHIDPLVQEYYRTGSINLVKMRSLDAVQPQCPACSNSQGWWMSQFSRAMRRVWGF